MSADGKKPRILFRLAAEGLVPVLGGCAGAVVGGPEGGLAGVAVGKSVEKAVNLFGREIVDRWAEWFVRRPPAEAAEAVSELVTLTPAAAREEARTILLELAPQADPADVAVAAEYLSALPRAVDRALVPGPAGAPRTLPPTLALADPRSLLQLLPEDVPPYPTGADLPGTPYRLVELVGTGGFGAVYRAFAPTLQHLPLAIKFCLDRCLLPALNQERSNLERLMRAGGAGAGNVVRLYGYDLDHPTPFLVYEYVAGGDLTAYLAGRRAAGARPGPAEVLGWVTQIADGLAFAHRSGLVHRDLKPANVLVDGAAIKLADFGLGGVAAARAAARSRIGTSTLDYLSLADQASLFRGAGTPLYMSPEQRRGADPDPRHDLYALGVVWFQLLVGDVTRELPHGWAKELAVRYGVPAGHVALLDRCVGWFDDRPKDAGDLLPLLRAAAGEPVTAVVVPPTEPVTAPPADTPRPTVTTTSATGPRRTLLASLLGRLAAAHRERGQIDRQGIGRSLIGGFVAGLLVGWWAGELVYLLRQDVSTFPNAFGYVPMDWVANAAGAGVGLAVWAVVVAVIAVWRRARGRCALGRAEGLADELAREFPAEVAAWGGPAVLRDPTAVAELTAAATPPVPSAPTAALSSEEVVADPARRAILVGRLRDLERRHRDTPSWAAITWVAVALLWMFGASFVINVVFPTLDKGTRLTTGGAMFFAGVVGLSAAAGVWWAMARARAYLWERLSAEADQLAADYPRLVAGWGGPAVLRSREAVEGLLRTYDPVRPPGWVRRWFG